MFGYALGMRGKRRWRTTVKWGLFACAIGIVVLWVASWKLYIAAWTRDWRRNNNFWVAHGVMSVSWDFSPSKNHREYEVPDFAFQWREPVWSFDWSDVWTFEAISDAQEYGATFPLWIPFALTFGPFLYLWHTDRKAAGMAKGGACASCGYDRVGLAAGVPCPECGALPKGAAAGGGAS